MARKRTVERTFKDLSKDERAMVRELLSSGFSEDAVRKTFRLSKMSLAAYKANQVR